MQNMTFSQEDADQSPEQAKTKATPISQHSSTVQYGPEREPDNAERMQVGIVVGF